MLLCVLCAGLLLVSPSVLRVEARISKRYVIGCPASCVRSTCPPPTPADCPAGEVLDQCDCCPVCASARGEVCGGTGRLGDPRCADGMQCVAAAGGAGAEVSATVRRRGKTGVCACPIVDPVCGSNGVSYRDVCELKRVSQRAQKVHQPPIIFIQRGACDKGRRWTDGCVGSRSDSQGRRTGWGQWD